MDVRDVARVAPWMRQVLQRSVSSTVTVEKDAQTDGIMVAVYPPEEFARSLAIPGGCPAEQLHITLAYIAPDYRALNAFTLSRLAEAVGQVVQEFGPLHLKLTGTGRFARGEDGTEPFYASVDSPELVRLRQALTDAFDERSVPYMDTHGFTPHITLAYLQPGQPDPLPPFQNPIPFTVDSIFLSVGPERYEAELAPGTVTKRIVEEDGEFCVRSETSGRSFGCYPTREEAEARLAHIESFSDKANIGYEVTQKNAEKRYTLGPMYMPDRLDAHGEFTDSDVLQEGVWDYMRRGDRTINLQHTDRPAGEFVELISWPYEATVEMTLPDEGTREVTFPEGTVYMGVVWEPWAWEMVKSGKLRGLSMGGRAKRIEADFGAEGEDIAKAGDAVAIVERAVTVEAAVARAFRAESALATERAERQALALALAGQPHVMQVAEGAVQVTIPEREVKVDVAAPIVTVPEQKAPVVNVTPEIKVEVAPQEVNITVETPPRKTEKDILRDREGNIRHITETEQNA